jgi:hypothetical protein
LVPEPLFPPQTVEEETQKAREDVKRAIKQRSSHTVMPLPNEGRVEGDFDALFGDDAGPTVAAAASGRSPGRKAVAAMRVQLPTATQRQQQQQQESSDRSLSSKRGDVQQQRPSSSKSSAKTAASTSRVARPASAPASTRTAAAAAADPDHDDDGLRLDASSSALAEPPASAAQVTFTKP